MVQNLLNPKLKTRSKGVVFDQDLKRKLSLWLFPLLFALLLVLAWQIPASFRVEASKPGNNADLAFLNGFYWNEVTEDGLAYRWASTGAKLFLPPLSGSDKIILRLSAMPPPVQPAGQLIISIDDKEAARFELKPDWNEYTFTLNKKLGAPGYLTLSLAASTFQPPNDPRLLMVAFNLARIETSGGVQIPPLTIFFVIWLAGVSFYLAGLFLSLRYERIITPHPSPLPSKGRGNNYLKRFSGLPFVFCYIFPALILILVAFFRPQIAQLWLVLLLAGLGFSALTFILSPHNRQSSIVNRQSKQSSVLSPDNRQSNILYPLILILLIAAFVRLYNLDNSPLGILPDEALQGYDAYSILKSGRDHHGEFLPLYFRSFNDYPPGVANYITVPFIAVFGLNLWAIRLPFALLGIGTVLFSYLLSREIFAKVGQQNSQGIGLLAALFVAVSPWAVSQSRIALPIATLSFFFLGGFWLLLRAKNSFTTKTQKHRDFFRDSKLVWVGSGLMLGVAVWTYPTMKLFMAVFVVGMLAIFRRFFWQHKKAFLLWAIPFGLVCLPFTVATLAGWQQINYRFNELSVWANNDLIGGLGQFLANYFIHFDPLRLFFKLTGDYTVTMSSRPPLIGIILPALAIPIVVGLVVTFSLEWRKQPAIWLLWLWLLLFPLGDAFTNQDVPDEIRAMSGVAVFEILAALGCWWLWQKLTQAKFNRLKYALVTLFGLALVISAGAYLHFTLVADPIKTRPYFRYGFEEALAQAENLVQPGGKICVETSSQAYMLVLFYNRYDPTAYQSFARQNDPPKNAPYIIKEFDKYKFNCASSQDLKAGDVGLARFPEGQYQLLWQTFYPNNTRAWVVVRK